MPKISSEIFLAIAGVVIAIVLVVLDKAGKLKGSTLLWLLLIAAVITVPLAISNPLIDNAPDAWKSWLQSLFLTTVFLGYLVIYTWVTGSSLRQREDNKSPTLITPSFVFVFGVPLGDNDSSSWMMLLKHYGPDPAFNCDINFYDNDRKTIEHQWLVAHPNSPYPPPGLAAGDSQKHVHVTETGPEGSAGGFVWDPLDPDRQHYNVSISCRDGVFEEKWEVTRVNGVLRSKITIARGNQWIQKNPTLDPVVFSYSDPEFVSTPLATQIPHLPKKVIHPGWKPNHRFEVPAAIIDPNGNVQVVSAVKAEDGSLITDFGCWNLLTRHFGDRAI